MRQFAIVSDKPFITLRVFAGEKNDALNGIAFEERNPNFVPCSLHAEKFEFFGVRTAVWPPLLLFQRLTPPETFERVSIIFDYFWPIQS